MKGPATMAAAPGHSAAGISGPWAQPLTVPGLLVAWLSWDCSSKHLLKKNLDPDIPLISLLTDPRFQYSATARTAT